MGFYSRHILPRLIDKVCAQGPIEQQRQKVVPRAHGTVLEIGIGGGLNLQYYTPKQVDKVVGIDPSSALFDGAMARADEHGIDLETIDCGAEQLPTENDFFDSVVLTYSLCTIPDPDAALQEIRRVLRPSGTIFLSEHGEAHNKRVAHWQRQIDPLWTRFAGGCHLNRPIDTILARNGFALDLEHGFIPGWRPASYHYWGTAQSA